MKAAIISVHKSVSDSYLTKLCHLIGNLSKTIPEAIKYNNKLGAFAEDPADYDIRKQEPSFECLWMSLTVFDWR